MQEYPLEFSTFSTWFLGDILVLERSVQWYFCQYFLYDKQSNAGEILAKIVFNTYSSNGEAIRTITYDEIGNPLTYREGKTVGSTEPSYFVDASGTMQAMKQGDEELVFMYDATGRREGFIWYHQGQKQGI